MKRQILFALSILLLLGCATPQTVESVPAPETATSAPAATVAATSMPIVEMVMTSTPEPTAIATPIPTPTPEPTPTPTPTPEPTPEPTPTPDPNRPMVALTFDDGPNNVFTPQFLDMLEKYNVRATFFVLASAIREDNWHLLQRMVDLNCEIGVHGQDHTSMTTFSASQNYKRIERTKREINQAVEGGYVTHLMRPPGGSRNGSVTGGARSAETAVIIWSVDSLDWKVRNTKKIVDLVQKEVTNGSIVLFHDRIQQTLEAIDILIPWLQEQGYELVTVTELLESGGEPIKYGKVYYHKELPKAE